MSFFQPVVAQIVDVVRQSFRRCTDENIAVDAVLVVGGFAASKVLRAGLEAEFTNAGYALPLIFPDDKRLHPGHAVVEGAVRGYVQQLPPTTAATFVVQVIAHPSSKLGPSSTDCTPPRSDVEAEESVEDVETRVPALQLTGSG